MKIANTTMDTKDTKGRTGGKGRMARKVTCFSRRRVGTPLILCVLSVLCGVREAATQVQMPDPKQMSGIPRPDGQMQAGAISVRLIRGDLSNNITGHPVELHAGDKVQTLKTDEAGRVEFTGLPAGTNVKAVAVVDGERLESQEFPVQAEGGIRLMLVATDKEKERQKAADAKLPPIAGQVVIGGDSRIVIEPSDESLSVYYILDIVNTARAPVNPPTPFVFDMPRGSSGTAVLQGSSPLATSKGNQVLIAGPFPSGTTSVQVGTQLPIGGDTVAISQTFPATLESLVVVAKKAGDMKLSSPQIERQQDAAVEGAGVIVGAGGTIPAGQPISLTLAGLPHYSNVPRRFALTLAVLVTLAGLWGAMRTPDQSTRTSERKRLIARREKLFQDLVRLEHDHKRGKTDPRRHAVRREELVASLEHIYGALDADDTGPDSSDRTGLAAPFDPSTGSGSSRATSRDDKLRAS